MNGFKKQWKEFWAFYRLSGYGMPVEADRMFFGKDSIFSTILFLGIILNGIQTSIMGDHMTISISLFMLTIVGVATGVTTRNKIALVNVAPFTPRQRVAFVFLATIVRSTIAMLILAAAGIVIMLFVTLVVFLATGENVLVVGGNEIAGGTFYSAYGESLNSMIALGLFFALFALAHMNNVKARNMSAIGFVGGLFVATAILNTVLGNRAKGGKFNVYVFGDTYVWIDSLAHPYIPLIVCGVLCAVALALAVYAVIKRYKSAKF